MDSVALSGNLTQDPRLANVNGRAICEMRLAVDNGRARTTYIDVRAFDEQAYVCAEYLHKGSKVSVRGRLAYKEWRNAAGERRNSYSVIGRVEFLDPTPLGDGGEAMSAAEATRRPPATT
jgi:single-strand DNA-binding protein